MESNGSKLIVGLENLAKFLKVSKPTIAQYISLGMPCGRIGNRWHFHLENVDNWLKNQLTNAKYKGNIDPQELEETD